MKRAALFALNVLADAAISVLVHVELLAMLVRGELGSEPKRTVTVRMAPGDRVVVMVPEGCVRAAGSEERN